MDGISLKSRAIAFAFCIGAVAFILALMAGADRAIDSRSVAQALVIALVCGVMSWGSAERALASVAESVDAATARVMAAAHGDLLTPTPGEVGTHLPELAESLDGLFLQVRSNLDSVHNLAMFDPVTALPNRTNFRRETDRLLRELGGNTPAALFFIDLDNFKSVNDSLGHAQGDQLLAMVANRLRAVVQAEVSRDATRLREPIAGRLAGDEFTLFVPDIGGVKDATRIARGLLNALSEPFELSGQQIDVGASIGVALRPDHGRTLTPLMRAADVAMYHAKANGRGQFQFFTGQLAERLADKVRLERELRDAIDRDQFMVLFQPQVNLAGGDVIACEGLLRWNHPTDGVRLPASFIAAAEETGLIVDIGDWAIEATAATLARWHKEGVRQRLAVNISPRQIERPDMFLRFQEAMDRHGAPAAGLEIELTESIAMQCGDAVLTQVAALRAQGAKVSIDDFGTGYSNLARLRSLPVDRVKLDRSLIADIATSAEARTIVHAVIGLVHGLGCEAVAEGVENADQIDVLRVIGCDAIQGFAIAAPMTEAQLGEWLRIERSTLAG